MKKTPRLVARKRKAAHHQHQLHLKVEVTINAFYSIKLLLFVQLEAKKSHEKILKTFVNDYKGMQMELLNRQREIDLELQLKQKEMELEMQTREDNRMENFLKGLANIFNTDCIEYDPA